MSQINLEIGDAVIVPGNEYGIIIERVDLNDEEPIEGLTDLGFQGFKVLVNDKITTYTCAALKIVSKSATKTKTLYNNKEPTKGDNK